MKKVLSVLIAVIMILQLVPALADTSIKIVINGENKQFDVMPVIVEGRTLVPMRGIFEALGMEVGWDDATKTASGKKDSVEVKLTIDNTKAYVNGKEMTLDVPATIINSRTMVPVRFISESIGAKVGWDDATKTVSISTQAEGKKLVKEINFDTLTKFEKLKEFVNGGAYPNANVTLSKELDHTSGGGQSMKMDNREKHSHRTKLPNIFTSADVGKTFEIKAWVYVPDTDASIRMAAYGDTNTTYAIKPIASIDVNVSKNTWTEVTLNYTHTDATVTQLGFSDSGLVETVAKTIYVDDIKIYEGGVANTPAVKEEVLKIYKFDDLTSFEKNKDFVNGGAYPNANVTLSNEKDHTTGSGKSLKLDNREKVTYRTKLPNVFSASDVGKTFEIEVWIYASADNSKVRLGAYGDTGTEFATTPIVYIDSAITKDEWTKVVFIYTHTEATVTQLGIGDGAENKAPIPTIYVDDITVSYGDSSLAEKPLVVKESYLDENGRRPVPTEFTAGKNYEDIIYYDEILDAKMNAINNLPEGEIVTSEEDFLTAGITGEQYGTIERIKVDGMPFTDALRIDVKQVPKTPYEYQIKVPVNGKIEAGDKLLLMIYMRTLSGGDHDTKNGQIQCIFELGESPNTKLLQGTVNTAGEWQVAYFPIEVLPGFEKNVWAPVRLGYYEQTIEIGGYKIVNYKQKVEIKDLPTLAKVNGIEKDAQWRREAWDRIEKIRKGDITVTVKDKNGNVIPNATVKLDMYETEFEWGTAIGGELVRNDEQGEKLRENIVKYFNAGVMENNLKWAFYEKNTAQTDAIYNFIKNNLKYQRGHAIYRDRYTQGGTEIPDRVFEKKDDYAYIQKEMYSRIDLMAEKYDMIHDWDVVNELRIHHTLTDIHGYGFIKDIYDYTRKAMPDASLYLNDCGTEQRGSHLNDFISLVDKLVSENVDFDGIGLQTHIANYFSGEQFYKILEELSTKYGKRLKITEYDNNLYDEHLTASQTRDLLIAMYSCEAVDGFYCWKFRDLTSQKNKLILDLDYNIKPVGEQFIDLVYNKWWTREEGKTDANGVYSTRGYFGDYDIKVTANGQEKTVTAKLYKNSDKNIVITMDW